MQKKRKTALIIGAGPAGLTVALELLKRTDIHPIIIEKESVVGGLSRTVHHKGNRMDIGGHRFFSKSDEIMKWWTEILPILKEDRDISDLYKEKNLRLAKKNIPSKQKNVFLIRKRLSRIFYRKKLYSYPISLSFSTIKNLGFVQLIMIMYSYFLAFLFPKKPEKTLEDFLINKFGRHLYITFFKEYTEKVWGVPCSKISSEWGEQRIKGLSITTLFWHQIKKLFSFSSSPHITQKQTQTSLIERFLYPPFGPGQLWEKVKKEIFHKGGDILFLQEIQLLHTHNNHITSITIKDKKTKKEKTFSLDYLFSSAPLPEFIEKIQNVPKKIKTLSKDLQYRDFITIGILCKKFTLPEKHNVKIKDNWIYIQEPNIKMGRIQIFNNWSPFLVKNPEKYTWIGLEYFTQKNDSFWSMSDKHLFEFAKKELSEMNMVQGRDILDKKIVRVEKAYPSYFGKGYENFETLRKFLLSLENFYPIGRNGMHRYNNQDHSMLSAIYSVDHILHNKPSKEEIWSINTEKSYHEQKAKS
jgi:protoporphyrinogen oxidase